MSTYRKLNASDLTVGKPLSWNACNAEGRLLLRQGYIVETQLQIDQLLALGLFSEQSRDEPQNDKTPTPAKMSPFDTIHFFQQRLRGLFQDIETGRCTNATKSFHKFAHDIQEIVTLNADAALGALHLDDECRYSISHPIHVAMLAECLARRLDMSTAERNTLICAALTANISMLELQETLHKQKEPLAPRQQEEIWSHPQRSVELLKTAGVTDEAWLTAVLHHHERLNGSGYMEGLSGSEVNITARILLLADTYCAMIKPRAYRSEIHAKEALKEIFMKRGSEIDETLALMFIKELGVFPPGSFVRLANGEIGVVIERGAGAAHPVVQAVISPRGGPYTIPKKRKTNEQLLHVKEIVPRDKTITLSLNRLWGYE